MPDVSALYDDVNTILNDAAVEVGLSPSSDAYADSDPAFRQLRYLLDSAGRKLTRKVIWQELIEAHTFTTSGSATYNLPANFGYMIPQSSWDRSEDVPLFGPLSPQDWQYLEGRGLGSVTIYASFRLKKGKVYIYPSTDTGTLIAFEYVRDTLCSNAAESEFYDRIQTGTNLVRFPPELVVAFLKKLFLEAKGFDSQAASDDYNDLFDSITGQDKSAPILNAGGTRTGFPYLNYANIPETGYGS